MIDTTHNFSSASRYVRERERELVYVYREGDGRGWRKEENQSVSSYFRMSKCCQKNKIKNQVYIRVVVE